MRNFVVQYRNVVKSMKLDQEKIVNYNQILGDIANQNCMPLPWVTIGVSKAQCYLST